MNPPFSWASYEDALAQINLENDAAGKPQYKGRLLHVVLDMSSGRLYLPDFEEKAEIAETPNLTAMLNAIKIKIEKLVDFVPLAPLIRGDPLNTIRIRKISDFRSVSEFIRKQVETNGEYEKDVAVPVVEADLNLMPKTAKELFGYDEGSTTRQWAYVKGDKPIEFIVSENVSGEEKDIVVCQQKPPFILINTASQAEVSEADKERCVVLGYKEYAAEHHPSHPDSGESPEVQTFKYLMYIGWSFKELSIFIYRGKPVNDFYTMLYGGSFLYNAAKMLEADGYPDPASNQFYYSFKVDANKFPVKFRLQAGVAVFDYSRQPEIFRIVYFDPKTSYITFKTPLYLPEEVLASVFHPKSAVMISTFDKSEKIIYTEADVDEISKDSPSSMAAVNKDAAKSNGLEGEELQVVERPMLEMVFERKHVSDYPQASEIIKDICRRLTKNPGKDARATPEEVRFDDLEVVVGPWSVAQGRSIGGAYYAVEDIKAFTGGKTEFEPVPGFKVSAPVIVIDNQIIKTVGDRTKIIIHEYRHHINVQLWVDSRKAPEIKNDDEESSIENMVQYLATPHERLAHKTQFKYMMSTGMSKEQILRDELRRKPTIKDVPLVKEYLSIINEAAKELEDERVEEEKIQDVKEEAKKKVDMFDPSTFGDSPEDMTVG